MNLDERLVLQFEPLLHKVLNQVGIRQTHNDYQDYLQELKLKLLTLAHKFKGDPFGVNIGQFISYCRKGLYWFMLDQFRREQRRPDEVGLDMDGAGASSVRVTDEGDLNVAAFLKEARVRLSERELVIFNMLAESAYTMQEIADYLGINRKTVHKHKKRIREKLGEVRGLLR